MKTLNEQINDVVKKNVCVAIKRRELLELGLTSADVSVLLANERRAANALARERRAAHAIENNMTYGVEIECYNAPRDRVIESMGARNLRVEDISDYGCAHNGNSTERFKLVPDGSISGIDPVECVTPILRGNNGLNTLKECCGALNAIGARVNKSTGLHVHVGGDITEKQYINTFANYKALEPIIDTFMAASRRGNNAFYAKSVMNYNFASCMSIDEIYAIMHGDRYHKINPCSWSRHNTIEFRQHQGSTDFKKIKMWVRFCVKLVIWSKENVLTETPATINDIPFLNDAEKRFFNERVNELSETAA